jgi:hypothetical protein
VAVGPLFARRTDPSFGAAHRRAAHRNPVYGLHVLAALPKGGERALLEVGFEELPNSLVDLGWFARSLARLKRFSPLGLGGVTLEGGDPDSEGASGLGLGNSSFYGIPDLPTEVFGIGFHQSMMPCSPSSSQRAVIIEG